MSRPHVGARTAYGRLRAAVQLATATTLLAAGAQLSAQQSTGSGDASLEEIVVTGTMIRGTDSFDTANPIDVLGAADLAERGATTIGEIFRNQSFQFGVETVSNVLGQAIDGTFQSGDARPNLRGLGSRSTLTLMNGRRTATNATNTLYPSIMIERIETLTDGAATIYGTDAVAGVVNLIPVTDFEGLEVRASYNHADHWSESVIGMMGGMSTDQSSFVFGAEFKDRGTLQFLDRPKLMRAGFSSSGDGNPGTWNVPLRGPDGQITDMQRLPDPGCGLNRPEGAPQDPSTPMDKTQVRNNPTGFVVGDTCRLEFGEFINYIDPAETLSASFNYEYRFTEAFRFEAEGLFSRLDWGFQGNSPSNPGGRLSELPVVSGEHPGNPYRAMADTDNDGVADTPLYAEDAGDGTPLRDGNGDVVLAPDPFDPAAGVPFNEDVQVLAWRVLGKGSASRNSERIADNGKQRLGFPSFENFRVAGRFTYEIPDTSWEAYLDYVNHTTLLDTDAYEANSLSGLQAGFEGELYAAGRNWYFNPFSTQNFECVNRDCSGGVPQSDPDLTNPSEVIEFIARSERERTEVQLEVLEFVTRGDLLDLPSGPLSAAFGVQRRHETVDADLASTGNARDALVFFQRLDWKEKRETTDVFAELEAPLFDNQTLGNAFINLAARRSEGKDNSTANLEETIFKVSGRWSPASWVALRASWGEAFVAPSLEDLFQPEQFTLENVADPIIGEPGTFRARGIGGNPDLEPETSEQINLGFSVQLLDGDLTFGADYKIFDFTDRISRPSAADVVTRDYERFLGLCDPDTNSVCSGGAFAGMSQADAAEQFILNNPNLPGHDPSLPAEDERIQRNPSSLELARISTPLVNVGELEWKGGDFRVQYQFDSSRLPFVNESAGQITVGLNGTWTQSMKVQTGPDEPSVDGAGLRNTRTGFLPPLPEWRVNGRVNWAYGRHSVTLLGRWTDSIREDDVICGLPAGTLAAVGASPDGCPSTISSHSIWDLQYSVGLEGWVPGGKGGTLQIGALNLFDFMPEETATLGGAETFLFDPRGRQLYARLRVAF